MKDFLKKCWPGAESSLNKEGKNILNRAKRMDMESSVAEGKWQFQSNERMLSVAGVVRNKEVNRMRLEP